MTIIAVVGDATTTTSVVLAASWPRGDDVTVVEADPSGGSLAGWLDTPSTPSLGTLVANAGQDRRSVATLFDSLAQPSTTGIRFVPNAVRARAASRAVDEAAVAVFPALGGADLAVIVDVGRHTPDRPVPAAVLNADVVVVVHHQPSTSAPAATVKLERVVELVEELGASTVVLAVIGSNPFDPAEIAAFVDRSVPGGLTATVELAHDTLAASVVAGRAGVSARRFERLPLMRTAAGLARLLYDLSGRAAHAHGTEPSEIGGVSS